MSTDPSDEQGFVLFGRDVTKMPCFRNTLLYGFSGGIGTGLLYFLLTSKTKVATDFGVASFAVISLSYWAHCRYNYSKTKFEMRRVQELLRQRAMYEGTEKMEEIQPRDQEPVEV